MRARGAVLALGVATAAFVAVAVAVVITYARVPPGELYHVSGTGVDAGFGRALVFLNFPVALAVLPWIVLAGDRLRRNRLAVAIAIVAAGLCAIVFVPGVVDQGDLDAKPINALPAVGVALGLALVAIAGMFSARARIGLAVTAGLAMLVVLALPWIGAELGFYLDRVPVLRSIFLTGEVVDGHPAVHHGHHHGMDGVLLVLAALATIPALRTARSRAVRLVVTTFLGLQVAYGLANFANDAWLEQVVKRGWTGVEIPNVLRPAISLPWIGIVLATPVFAAGIRRRAEP